MSLRRKLILFFLAIAVFPVALLAYLLIDLSQQARIDRAEAELRAGMLSVDALYDIAGQVAPQEVKRVADRLAGPMSRGDDAAAARIVNEELGSRVISAVILRDAHGKIVESAGPELTLARTRLPIWSNDDRRLGSVEVRTIDVRAFLTRIEQRTNQTAALVRNGEVIASTDPVEVEVEEMITSRPENLTSFEVDASTGQDLGAALDLAQEPGEMRLLLLSYLDGGLITHPLAVIGLLVVLLLVALAVAAWMLNRLRRRLNDMLDMTRRIGAGDFSGELSEAGNDEMAALAREINRMRTQIASQMEELQRQRSELDGSVRRLGEAFASGMDRNAIFEVLIETATTACGARRGQVLASTDEGEPTVITAGDDPGALTSALSEASSRAVAAGGSATVEGEGAIHAMAEVIPDRERGGEEHSIVAVAREGNAFTESERETLRYLIRQCAISIENIALHEQVAKQAVTDDLTGLANHRALTAWIEREMQRVHRYGEPLSLLMIDVDEFKRINDTFGHPQGDRVLRGVAEVIKRESREVDEAARYGGDEFVLALPGTDSAGAAEVAERIRQGIAAIPAAPDGGSGEEGGCRVSASLGVAGTDSGITDATELIAAADDALYRAKAKGKDRVATSAPA